MAKIQGRATLGRLVFDGNCALGEIRGVVAKNLRELDLTPVAKQKVGCTPRVQRLRMQFYSNRPTVCLHRARIYTKVYKETESEPIAIRRGKAFKRYWEEKPVIIQDDELIVGTPGCNPRSVVNCPEVSWLWLSDRELERLAVRPQDPYLITEEQKTEIREEIIPYWKGKSVYEWNLGHLPPETRRLCDETNFIDVYIKQGQSPDHCVIGIGNRLLPYGFKGIEAIATETMSKLSLDNPKDHEKIEFLQGAILACEAMKIVGEKYAAEARRLAEEEKNPERKKELLGIAEVCDWVPWNPPRTFREAVQAAWFAMMAFIAEQGIVACGPGRFDQYMLPYYERDIREGRLTKEQAQELIECLWIKEAEIVWPQSEFSAKYFAGYQGNMNCNLGGTLSDGSDATNELTYMCMKATEDVKLAGCPLVARINRKSPDEYMMRIAELIRQGMGYPALFNDDVGIPVLLSLGCSIEDSYNYDVMGCSEAQVQGKMWKYSDGGQFNMPACLEFALNDGYSRMRDRKEGRWGLPTGDPRRFKSYEEVEDAFKKQLAYFTEHICIANMVTERAWKTLAPYPYTSTLFDYCLERGMDYTQGGCKYNVGPAPSYIGLADVANSLASIKKLVFEEKAITMEELIDALDNNFEGRESLRLLLLNHGPKYGRDDSYVDNIAKMVADYCHEESSKYINIRGCRYTSAMFPVAANTPLGVVVGALPSGRKAGVPIADGISPQQGTDKSPTEVIKSVTSFDHIRHENGLLLNIKFSPAVLEGEKGLRNFVSLVRTFCQRGGWHIQVNVVDAATLKNAQKHPENYTTLMVRVAGYSAYFNDLSRETQDDIISRVEHSFK